MRKRGPRTNHSPDQPPNRRSPGGAIGAVSRLLAIANEAERPEALARALVREARAELSAPAAVVFAIDQRSGRAVVAAAEPQTPHREWFALDDVSPLAEALENAAPLALSTAQARELALASGLQPRPQAALLAPMPNPGGVLAHALMVADDRTRVFEDDEIEAAGALAEAAGASMAQRQLAERHGAERARQASIARAA